MEVDRRTFLAAVGVGAVGAMSHEDRAEELEHYMMHRLDDSVAPEPDGEESALIELHEQQQGPTAPRGTGNLFTPRTTAFEPMPDKPTLQDFFRLRFADIIGRNFKQPKEGLGYDNSPSAHMWRTIANPNRPL